MRHFSYGLFLALVALYGVSTSIQAADEAKAELKGVELEKVDLKVSGLWHGSYAHLGGGGGAPFSMVLFQEGKDLFGYIDEPNTFARTADPKLHATFKGTVDPVTRALTFTKTYDGTGGESHNVEYTGTFAEDGQSVENGKWSIPGFTGTFTLARDPKVKPGKLTGIWRGANEPPEDSKLPKVKSTLVLLHRGDQIIGLAREPRRAPDGSNPWFHANLQGSFDEETGTLKLTKTYDGTAQATGVEQYLGALGEGEKSPTLAGKRTSDDKPAGRFHLSRQTTAEE